MRKPIPSMRRLALPVALSCLSFQPLLAHPLATAAAAEWLNPTAGPVSGRIVDEKGTGLPGVNVIVKGTTTGTQTDADGRYTIQAPDGATLVFSFVGYASQEVAVGGRSTVDTALVLDSRSLTDVVVVGYLTQDRQNVTSAVSSLNTREAAKAPVPTLAQAIQGRTPGVLVEGSSAPGSVPSISIRGIGSLNAGSVPLYVIDGLWTDNIRDLSPTDIETVTVLKDASSTAVYGSRGANGVIVITTKRGQAGTPKVSFNSYVGAESIYRKYNLTNASEWADRSAIAYTNAGLPILPGADKKAGTFNPNIDTDWQKEFFRTGIVQDHNLTFSGGSREGNNSSNFLISAGYFNQQGVVKGPQFERYNLRLNSGLQRGRFRLNESVLLTHINTTLLNGNPFVDVLTILPGIPVYDPTTTSGFGYGNPATLNTYSVNPVAAQQILKRTQTNNLLQGSITGEFNFTDYLSYKLNVGLDFHLFADKDFRGEGRIRLGDTDLGQAYLIENRGTLATLLVENTLNFSKRFGEHGVNAVAGYSEQKYDFNNSSARNNYLTAANG
ncbi:MAG: SusC/RagA family TonB-linked outer membrane protein, partial [Hymenobacter sp.]